MSDVPPAAPPSLTAVATASEESSVPTVVLGARKRIGEFFFEKGKGEPSNLNFWITFLII